MDRTDLTNLATAVIGALVSGVVLLSLSYLVF